MLDEGATNPDIKSVLLRVLYIRFAASSKFYRLYYAKNSKSHDTIYKARLSIKFYYQSICTLVYEVRV
jgi:hypothetical protein